MNKICLNMIVRNESAIITRCLDSVGSIIDFLVITDTGSTDSTIQLINTWAFNKKIPAQIFQNPWVNFSTNRTQSISNAIQFLKKKSIPLDQVYLLFIDADMILENLNFSKSDLKLDYYLVKQYNEYISYYNIRLAKANLNLTYKSVTHEYLDIQPETATSSKLLTLQINDIGDGGCKTLESACSLDKFERDIKLLTQGIKDEPDNSRYYFYLAQSYKDLGDNANAIKYYTQRVQMGGWAEEIGYSYLMLGQIEFDSNPSQAVKHFEKSFDSFGRVRAEPLYWLAKIYLNKLDYSRAYKLLTQAIKLPYPESQVLFINDTIYNYGLYKELSIVAYYIGKKDLGLVATDYVKFMAKKLNTYPDPLLNSNQTYYLNPIDYTNTKSNLFASQNITCSFKQINQTIGQGLMNINSSSYWVTINIQTNKILHKGLIDGLINRQSSPVQHIIYRGKLYAFFIQDSKLVIAHFNSRFEITNLIIIRHKTTFVPIPVEYKGLLCLIMSLDPFVLVQVNVFTGFCSQVINCTYNYNFTSFNGSAGPVSIGLSRQLLLIYELAYVSDTPIFSHRFLEYDDQFHLQRISEPFYFNKLGNERCWTLMYFEDTDSIILYPVIENTQINKIQIQYSKIKWLEQNLKQKIDNLIG